MEKKFKFTQAKLNRLACPIDKNRAHFQDEMRPELQFQITSKGAKSYYCRCWNRTKGYTDRLYIGRFEQTDLSEARTRAREMAVLADQGRDPVLKSRVSTRELTFAEAFDSFIADPANRKKKGPRREVTTNEYQKQYKRYLAKEFRTRNMSTIESSEVDDFHTQIGENNGTYAANRALTLMSGVFNDASSKGWNGINPAKGIEAFPERRRSRFLEEHELGPFIKACEAERNDSCRTIAEALLVALFTGLRRTNICSASWQHINLERGIWHIPDSQMKNDENHTVYLCDYLQQLLVGRYKYRSSDEWVFPGIGKTGHIVEPKKGLLKIAQLAKIDAQGVNMHCLKHTFLTYADDLGLPSAVRKRLAAHKGKNDVTDGYTHARESRVQQAYEDVAQHMLQLAREASVDLVIFKK